jgi:DNA-binding transcriptional ArsR family regulator
MFLDMSEADVFRALGDPTRRAVFEKLARGAQNATELRAGLPISQPAMSQHLAVLREAGLIREKRAGRAVQYSIEPAGLAPLRDWMLRYRAFWPDRLEDLQTLLAEMDQ